VVQGVLLGSADHRELVEQEAEPQVLVTKLEQEITETQILEEGVLLLLLTAVQEELVATAVQALSLLDIQALSVAQAVLS
jgi:hypothetical protein